VLLPGFKRGSPQTGTVHDFAIIGMAQIL